jgi:hypothetical protein
VVAGVVNPEIFTISNHNSSSFFGADDQECCIRKRGDSNGLNRGHIGSSVIPFLGIADRADPADPLFIPSSGLLEGQLWILVRCRHAIVRWNGHVS